MLEAGLYTEDLVELYRQVPEMHLQITTEAVGRYSPEEMTKIAYDVMPPGISIGVAEMMPSRQPSADNLRLYQSLYEAGCRIQHLCYQPEDVDLMSSGLISLRRDCCTTPAVPPPILAFDIGAPSRTIKGELSPLIVFCPRI